MVHRYPYVVIGGRRIASRPTKNGLFRGAWHEARSQSNSNMLPHPTVCIVGGPHCDGAPAWAPIHSRSEWGANCSAPNLCTARCGSERRTNRYDADVRASNLRATDLRAANLPYPKLRAANLYATSGNAKQRGCLPTKLCADDPGQLSADGALQQSVQFSSRCACAQRVANAVAEQRSAAGDCQPCPHSGAGRGKLGARLHTTHTQHGCGSSSQCWATSV